MRAVAEVAHVPIRLVKIYSFNSIIYATNFHL
jgi:hypothetical protein